jgi:penicillin-binding protein 1A
MLTAPYVAEMAHQKMIELYGKKKAYTAGFRVYTTVSSKLQKAANNAVTTNLYTYDQRHGYRGALFSLRPPIDASSNDASNNQITQTLNDSESDQPLNNALTENNIQTGPISEEEFSNAFSQVTSYENLTPAVVTNVADKSATIRLNNGMDAEINWPGMSWARAYINDQKQGTPPKTASDILNIGDMIYVTSSNDDTYLLSQLPSASAALISISPDNGAIKAAVGGFSFQQSQFNRVTQAKRQVGSNIKPFIYSAALEHGYTLASLINDAPINHWDKSSGVVWRPKN